MIHRICAEVDKNRGRTVALLQSLVRINTANPYCGDASASSEREGQEFLKPVLEDLGGVTHMFDCPDGIYEKMGIMGPRKRDFRGRPNLVAEFRFGDAPTRIVLNGHMDTVGGEGMDIEPFSGDVKDGKVWGRGASDCKGGLTAGIAAIQALLPFAEHMNGTVVFQSVVDEECNGGGAGTMACCDAGHSKAQAVIALDGNDLVVTHGCNGCVGADVYVDGLAGHAARGTGVNAIDKAVIVKQAVDEFKRVREATRPDCRLNLGVFQAGVHPAVVPASAWLSLNIVYDIREAAQAEAKGLGWGAAEIRAAFERAISHACQADVWLREHPARVEWIKDLIPFDTPAESPLVQGLCAAGRSVLGRDIPLNWMVAWSDATYHPRFAHTPTVLFGPGSHDTCHSPVEYVPIDNMINCAKVVAAYVYEQLKRR